VLTDAPSDARVWTDEVFGPVVVIRPYGDLDAAIDPVNPVDTIKSRRAG
jgi:acyl-CoA reductase-like NAD-dependent aldehyde dehydrogenase